MAYYQDDDSILEQFFDDDDADLVSYYDRYGEAIIGRFWLIVPSSIAKGDYMRPSGYSSPTPHPQYASYSSNFVANSQTQDYPHYTSAQYNHNALPDLREPQYTEEYTPYQLPPIRSSGTHRRACDTGLVVFRLDF